MTPLSPSYPVLRRFDIWVFRDKSVADKAQVPALARVEFYGQGATVRTGGTIAPGATQSIQVWHTGTVINLDKLQVDLTSQELEVVGEPTADSISLKNNSGQPVSLSTYQRLLRTIPAPGHARPLTYIDPNGITSVEVSYVDTVSGVGRAVCYIRELRFDYVVWINDFPGGLLYRLFVDAEGSYAVR